MKRRWMKWTLIGLSYPAVILVTFAVTCLMTWYRADRYFFRQFDTLTQFRSSPGCPLNRTELGLSDEDVGRVNKLCRSFNRKEWDQRGLLREKRSELAGLLVQPVVDTLAVMDVTGQICTMQSDMETASVRHILNIRELLTPEQREKFAPFAREAVCHWEE